MFIEILNSVHAGYFFMLLLSSADNFKNNLQKIMPGPLSECQMARI